MKRKLMELVLIGASLALMGTQAPAQTPADQPPAETAPKSEPNTTGIRIGAGVLLLVIVGVILMRRKGKKKTEDEF